MATFYLSKFKDHFLLNILIIFFYSILFSSCQTAGSIKKEFHNMETNLYYELTTPIFESEIKDTLFLNPISHSKMNPDMLVKRKRLVIIPLILYNHSNERFKITLGEQILNDSYSNFFTKALLAECNRSSCFQLENDPINLESDPEYTLDINVLKNETTSSLKFTDNYFFIPTEFFEEAMTFVHYDYESPNTKITIQLTLLKNSEPIFEKVFTSDFKVPKQKRSFDDPYFVKESCAYAMTECLSLATKQLVEEISSYLHLYMLSMK